jgi:hypothetical protein
MATKKQDLPVAEKTNNKPSEYEEIHKKTFRQIAATPTVEETTTPESKEESEAEPELDELDKRSKEVRSKRLEERKSQVADEVANKVKETLAEERSLLQKERDDKKREEDSHKPYVYKWEAENRTPKDYKEIAEEARQAALIEAKQMMEEREEAKARDQRESDERRMAQEKIVRDQEEKTKEVLNKRVEDQLNELYKLDKLPKIKDEKNNNDEGVIARNDFFKFGAEFNSKRLAQGLDPLFPLELAHYYHPKSNQPAGADAPIMGNKAPASDNNDSEINYPDIHRLSFRELAAKALRRGK